MRSLRLLTIPLALLLPACGDGSPQGTKAPPAGVAAKLSVQAVSYPLAYFAGRIGGPQVEVGFPVPTGIDPALWSPPLEAIRRYQEADLVLLNGAGYARWTANATLPPSRLVDTSRSFQDSYAQVEDAPVHTHGPEGEHSHGEIAFTTWLDPRLALAQAAAIRDAFIRSRPLEEERFRAGFRELERDLLELDRTLEGSLMGPMGATGVPLLASHPVYQYLARRYELDLRSVRFEPDEAPAPDAWRDLSGILRAHPARWMIWEAPPLAETAARLRELGVEVLVFEPCGNRPPDGDFLSVMRANAENLREAFP